MLTTTLRQMLFSIICTNIVNMFEIFGSVSVILQKVAKAFVVDGVLPDGGAEQSYLFCLEHIKNRGLIQVNLGPIRRNI